MFHNKTKESRIFFCTRCNKRTVHFLWQHEVAYGKKTFFGLFTKTAYGLTTNYECDNCHRAIKRKFLFRRK